ncbi:MAG: 1-(5-phosphoribosyl)-5-[(5-phosphoribosylamino)methylideneamino]imidazole-4-carboxamide isomerase [Candidatus Odinarchaeota archaeon]
MIPAVDIQKGRVVRLYQGKANQAKEYYGNPIDAAKLFEDEGAEIIHVVDLDAAMERGDNSDIILKIAERIKASIQVGGGIRTLNKAVKFLNGGVERIVLGTVFFSNRKLSRRLIQEYGKGRIVAAVDHYRGEVKIRGWLQSTNIELFNYLNIVEGIGPGYILLSSIEGDGTMSGLDLETIRKVIKHVKTPLIIAGGASSLKDLIQLKKLEPYGVIIGRALYEKAFTLAEAIKIVGGT